MTAQEEPRAVRHVTIVNSRGLHARASAKFVRLAGTFNAEVTVVKNDMEVSGSSIMGLMMLAAAPGRRCTTRKGSSPTSGMFCKVRLSIENCEADRSLEIA